MNKIILPIIVFIITSLSFYTFSNDPDKKKKPIKFIISGLIISIITFIIIKFRSHFSPEPLMQGNYFD